jgi:integrase
MRKRKIFRKLYKDSYTFQVTVGYHNGQQKRKTYSVKGTLRDARAKYNDVVHSMQHVSYIEPTKLTVKEFLEPIWLRQREPGFRLRTVESYKRIIHDIVGEIGFVRLQQLRASDLKALYEKLAKERELSQRTLAKYHAMLSSALADAAADDLIVVNPCSKMKRNARPKSTKRYSETITLLDLDQIKTLLLTADGEGHQTAALAHLLVKGGLRKNEAAGTQWKDIDFASGTLTITRQLVVIGPEPVFGPPKSGKDRVIDLDDETLQRLSAHKKGQAELKLANRLHYHDIGLVFAKESRSNTDKLGMPLGTNNLGYRWLDPLLTKAGLPHVRVHDLRHCCAALMIFNGESLQTISERLGHKDMTVTATVYAHLLKGMQREAANRLGAALHG